jgi:SAM-dependent methyltransferase
MSSPHFDDLTDAYEAMIDWPRRLAHETPFYRWLFDRVDAKRLLDAACGTGHHVALFHSWGLALEGADLSPAMVNRCRARHGESDNLRWAIRGYDQPVPAAGSFDVVICTGNSLALAADTEIVAAAVREMLTAVRSGGALLIHLLNFWRLPDGEPMWQKCRRAPLPQGDSLIIKGVHRCGSRGYVHMLVTLLTTEAGSNPTLRSEAVPFLGLSEVDLEGLARTAGASAVELYGGYDRRSYHRTESPDLILLASP